MAVFAVHNVAGETVGEFEERFLILSESTVHIMVRLYRNITMDSGKSGGSGCGKVPTDSAKPRDPWQLFISVYFHHDELKSVISTDITGCF